MRGLFFIVTFSFMRILNSVQMTVFFSYNFNVIEKPINSNILEKHEQKMLIHKMRLIIFYSIDFIIPKGFVL